MPILLPFLLLGWDIYPKVIPMSVAGVLDVLVLCVVLGSCFSFSRILYPGLQFSRIGHFLTHFLAKACPLAFSGACQSRLMQLNQLRVHDRGSLQVPLILDRLGPDLQSCLDQWEGQSYVHALQTFHDALTLQIHRFEHREDR